MANSTSTQRSLFAPACNGKGSMYHAAYSALDAILKKYNYHPRSGVTGAYNCRKITGGTGYSLHAYGPGGKFTFFNGLSIATSLAVDINWDKNPYGPRLITDMPREMVDEIEDIRTNSGAQLWRWGGYYTGNKDAMHFEIVCSPADLASGIRSSGGTSTPPVNMEEDDEMARLIKGDQSSEWWVATALNKRYVVTAGHGYYGSENALGLWQGGTPTVVPQSFVDELPTLVTEDWIKAALVNELNRGTAAGQIDWAGTARETLATGQHNTNLLNKILKSQNTTTVISDEQIQKVIDSLAEELDSISGLDDATKEALKKLTPEAIADAVVDEISS